MARSSRKTRSPASTGAPSPAAALSTGPLESAARASAVMMLAAGSAREASREAQDRSDRSRTAQTKKFWLRVKHLILSRSRSKRNPGPGFHRAPRPPKPKLPPPMFRPAAHSPIYDNPERQFGLSLKPLPGTPPYDKIYDPRTESVRAVARGTKGKWGVAVGKYARRDQAEIIQRSWERYQDPDHLIRARQAYELMLSKSARQRGVFRIVAEPTEVGWYYFVWPMAGRQQVPKGYSSLTGAQKHLRGLLQRGAQPREALPEAPYTRHRLRDWMPPEVIFTGRSGAPTAASQRPRRESALLPGEVMAPKKPKQGAPKKRAAPKQRAATTTKKGKSVSPLLQAYRDYSTDWFRQAGMMERYRAGKPPPRR